MSEDWKTYLTPHFTYVVQNLRPVLVLDKLREKQLLAPEECTQLHNLRRQVTDQDCCRELLDILSKKGPDSFRRFLEVLRCTTGQEHIANEMKPMDTSSSSFREQRDRKSQLDDASGIATVKMYPPSSSQQRELPMVSSEQEELLLQSLIAVIADLRPTLLLDDLRWYGILTEEEYKQLQQGSLTESERSHRLLHDILPSKRKGSVTVFCEVLDQIDGQKHLLKGETEATSLGKVTEVEVVGQSHGHNGAASKEDQLPGTEHMDCQQGIASVPNQDVPSTSKKRKLCFISCPPSKLSRRNFAVFFFKPELEESIAPLENAIGSMCAASFGIKKESIIFAYTKMADLHPLLEAWGHPCFMDLDSKLAVLVVHGTKQPVNTDSLEGLIVTYLQKVNPDLELPPGECSMVEIITGSSFIVLSLSTNLYISLLCALGNKESRTELSSLLKEALPGSNKAILRLGGLPPLVLLNDLTDTHNSGEKENFFDRKDQGGAVATEKTSVVASKENYGNVFCEGDVSTVVQKESQPALEGHVSSLQDSTVERRSADVHKLLLAESSTDTSKDQYDGNLLEAPIVTSATCEETQSEFQQPILQEQKTPQEHSDLSRLPRIASEVYQPKQSMTTRSMMHTLKDLKQQVCRCFDMVDSCDNTLESSKQELRLMRVNVQHQKEMNKQRSEALDEASKSSLNISVTKAVDLVVASYARMNQSLMSTSVQFDSLYDMTQQFAEVMQSLRGRYLYKLEQVSAHCHQLLEDVESRITGLMLLDKEEEQSDQKPDPPERGGDGEGHRQSEQGWRCVYDAVMMLPRWMVIKSVVKQCATEWYHLAVELGYRDSDIQDMTFDIPTPEGKLQAIFERQSVKHGEENAVEALLDVCDLMLPLATVAAMEDLGIKYTGTVFYRLLYEVGKEVGRDWKKVAKGLGLTSQDMDNIKMKAKSSRKRAWKMLQLWHFKMRKDLSVDEIHKTLYQIRRRNQTNQETKYVIFPENVHVVKRVCGRSRELEGIAREFWGQTADRETPRGIPRCCLQIVNGMGGIGKSAVSLQYAIDWKEMYRDGVFHFNVESLTTLHVSIRANLRDLSLESAGGGVFEDNKIFLQYVYSKDKVLLLYDGADDVDLIKNILPQNTAHVHMLVTTRMSGDHPILARANKIISLGRLDPDAGVEVVQAWRGHAGEELDGEELILAKHVVSESPIEGLPIAIVHVATLMRKAGVNFHQYYQLFRAQQAQLETLALNMDELLHYFKISNLKEPLMHRGVSKPNDLLKLSVEDVQSIAIELNDGHLLSLARHFVISSNPVHLTWKLAIETVKDMDSVAMNILLYASLMFCRNIPECVVRPLLFSDMFAFQYHKSVSTLRSHTLVDVSESTEGCSLHMHPLVQSTLLEQIMRQPEELHYRLNRMAHSLLRLLPHSDNDIMSCQRDDQFLSLIPHVYAVAEKAVWIRDDATCDALVMVACHVALLSHHVDIAAFLCYERLKATGMTANNWQRLTALFDMGRACDLMANPQSAQLHFMEALQLIESSSDWDKARMEHYYEQLLSHLARCYSDQQMFTDAERLYQTQLFLLKQRPEENRQEIAVALNNIALSFSTSGQTQRAIERYEQVVEMMEGDPETHSLSLSTSILNLGACFMENGQYKRALPLLERSLSIMRENLPGGHFNLANALRELSRCCENLGDVERAMKLCEESVTIASHCLPNDHPHIAAYVGQLASCYQHAGRLDQAIHLEQQCIGILRQNLPSTRSNLCASLNNLAAYHFEKGMVNEAIQALEESLAARRSFLPPAHPDIGLTLYNLGYAYKNRNDGMKATELWRECLSIFEKCLSATHPRLMAVLSALGNTAFSHREYDESLQMYRRIYDILMRVSPKSEEMATVLHNMGMCYKSLSQWDAAEEAFEQSLQIHAVVGPQGRDQISMTEQALHEVWQLKFGQW